MYHLNLFIFIIINFKNIITIAYLFFYHLINPFFSKNPSLTQFSNSLSDCFFLASIIDLASSPTVYLIFGLSEFTASKITSATIFVGKAYSNIGKNASNIFWVIG